MNPNTNQIGFSFENPIIVDLLVRKEIDSFIIDYAASHYPEYKLTFKESHCFYKKEINESEDEIEEDDDDDSIEEIDEEEDMNETPKEITRFIVVGLKHLKLGKKDRFKLYFNIDAFFINLKKRPKRFILRHKPFNWEDVQECLEDTLDSSDFKDFAKCFRCGRESENLKWIRFKGEKRKRPIAYKLSPYRKLEWKEYYWRSGSLSICPVCNIQVELILNK